MFILLTFFLILFSNLFCSGPPEELETGQGIDPIWSPPPQSFPEHPDELLGEEENPLTWGAVHNLDTFFSQVYRYWEEKGFAVILVARILNLAALAFTIFACGVLLLGVDYSALHAECLKKDTCNVWDVAVIKHPLAGPLTLWKILSVTYLTIFVGYWAFAAAHLLQEFRGLAEVRHFFASHLGLSERALRAATWPEVAARLVASQRNVRLCIARDLTEHDIVSRIMRRDNYLIGMLNKGVLALHVPIPGLRGHMLMTKTVEWNLRWCILDPMFEESTFKIRQSFIQDEASLRRRFRIMAIVNALFSPFLLIFLVIYFFMKNAEALYHHPSSIGARRWSPAARWSLREFNELPYFVSHRLNAGHGAAERYVAQFPNHPLSHVARFIAFVAGSFAAVLIALTLADERLLERDLFGNRQTVWWLALLGVILAASRALIVEPSTSSFDPGMALLEVAAHTHYLPRHWRGRAHTLEVQEEFESLFRYRAGIFLEELCSVLLAPVLLWHSLPRCAGAILDYVENNTVSVDGVGDVCAQAAFQLRRHSLGRGGGGGAAGGRGGAVDTLPVFRGSSSPNESVAVTLGGGPISGVEQQQHREVKLEKSLVSFAATYPTWQPPSDAQEFLNQVAAEGTAAASAVLVGESPFEAVGGSLDSLNLNFLNNDAFGGASGSVGWMNDSGGAPLLSLLTSRYPHFAKVYLRHQHSTLLGTKASAQAGTSAAAAVRGGTFEEEIGEPSNSRQFLSSQNGLGYPSQGVDPLSASPGAVSGSLFASAVAVHAGAPLLPLARVLQATAAERSANNLSAEDERIAVGQALLQSFYDSQQLGQATQVGTGAHNGSPSSIGLAAARRSTNATAASRGDNVSRSISGSFTNLVRNGSIPRPVPPASSSYGDKFQEKVHSVSGTPRSLRKGISSISPLVSPGSARSLRERSSELTVISREPSEAVEASPGSATVAEPLGFGSQNRFHE